MPKPKYTTPGPGSYDVRNSSTVRYGRPRTSSFSNSMCQYDREKTGPLSTSKKMATPSPDQYGVQAATQALRVKIQPGQTRFGTEERKGPIDIGKEGKSPGPGQYINTKKMPWDKISQGNRKRAAPSFSFGGNNITRSEAGSSSTPNAVGPNSYNQGTGIGKMTLSSRPTSPTWGLGSASRDQVQKVNSPGYRPVPALNTPGPGAHHSGAFQSVGKQVLSTGKSSPTWGQGTSKRPDPNPKSITPGPGTHQGIPSSIKNQKESKRATAPTWSFGTSTRPDLNDGLVG